MTSPSAADADNPVSPEQVGQLARWAALPLARERWTVVADILGPWLKDANELSEKMSDPAHQALVPVTVFGHGAGSEKEVDR